MSRLSATLLLDAKLQARNRIYIIVGIAALGLAAALRYLVPPHHLHYFMPLVALSGVSITTFFLVAVLLLLERTEGTLDVVLVSPLRPAEYLASKLITLTALFVPDTRMLIVLLGTTAWPGISRLTRAELLSLKERDFVHAARGLGMGELRIFFRHLLPNALTPLTVAATLRVGALILVEASLSFLGLGVPEPYPSWGRMLSESAAEYARVAPWLVIFPGLAISAVVFGTNLLGDALRDILDPRQRS